ncbi:MAG: YraN family protein [Steroidobacteraceae bacterium]
MPTPLRAQLGQFAEQRAAEWLQSQGVEILLRNFRRRSGEIDLVGRQRDTLLIIEVRLRQRSDFGGSAASVDSSKQTRLIRTTQQLLQQHRDWARLPVRFDVIAIERDTIAPDGWRLEWIRHAFEARG